jgi:tetratricopeptide (TPR) repeat protein
MLCTFGIAASFAAEEKWTKVTAEYFTILTPASASTAQARAIELEQFRRGLQAILPVPPSSLRPVTVVLFKNRRAMEPFLPLENGKPARLGGFFARTNDLNTIALSMDTDEAEVRRVVFHEAVHWHLSAFDGYVPLWVGEGIAELYATFELTDDKTYRFGSPIPEHVALLRREKFLPLPELLGVGRESLLYNEGTRAGIFYAQSWALLHFLFYGEKSPGREALSRYLAALRDASATQEAFRTAFGADYATVEKQLRRYIEKGSYRRERYPRTTDDIARSLKTSPAAPGELALAKGSLLLGANRRDEAESHLQEASTLLSSDPRAWELLGHLALERKDHALAKAGLSKAAAAGSTSYLVYHNLAVTYFPQEEPTSFPATPDAEESDKAAMHYRKAIALAPSYVPSYEGLAGLMQCMKTFEASDVDLLVRGNLLAPDSLIIPVGIAIGEIRAGKSSDGRRRLEALIARHEGSSDRGLAFARNVLAGELMQADAREIDELAKTQRFSEAIVIADRALARGLPPAHEQTMRENRHRLAGYRTISEVIKTANRGEIATAKKMLEELLAANPERSVAAEAQRLLGEIRKSEERLPRRPNNRDQPGPPATRPTVSRPADTLSAAPATPRRAHIVHQNARANLKPSGVFAKASSPACAVFLPPQ